MAKNCTYTLVNESQEKKYSYAELAEKLKECILDDSVDILFRKLSIQQETVNKIEASKVNNTDFKFGNLSSKMDMGMEIQSNSNLYTPLSLINSKDFMKDGEPIMRRFSTASYAEVEAARRVAAGEMTEEEAELWKKDVESKWSFIGTTGFHFHHLMMEMSNTNSINAWGKALSKIPNNPFKISMLHEAENAIFAKVVRADNSKNNSQFLKNINLTVPLKGLAEDMAGHIDYITVNEDGTVQLTLIKTSTEPFENWDKDKIEAYKYQLALLKQMLAYNGIKPSNIKVNIIPVQITFDENFENVMAIKVQESQSMDTYNSKYNFTKYDIAARQFVSSNITNVEVTSDNLKTATVNLQHIFPGRNVKYQGLQQTAAEWLKANWYYCKPDYSTPGKVKITIPDYNKVIEATDTGKKSQNAELIEKVAAFLERVENQEAMEGEEESGERTESNITAKRMKTIIRDALQFGEVRTNLSGSNIGYLISQMTKYLEPLSSKESEQSQEEGAKEMLWEIIDSPELNRANIILLRNKRTSQIDVLTLTGNDPNVKCSFKERNNLLGAYLRDVNTKNFTLESNYGNIEAVRTVALLNEILPNLKKKLNFQLGELRIIGTNFTSKRKGVFFSFDNMLKTWNTIVTVVNENNEEAHIKNKFQENDIHCIKPEVVLYDAWKEIIETNHYTKTLYDPLEELFKGKKDAVGRESKGILDENITEDCKIEQLQALMRRLQAIDKGKHNINDVQSIVKDLDSRSTSRRAFARLYVLTAHALAHYYGDISPVNEYFSSVSEWGIKQSANRNSNLRREAFLVAQSIDNSRGKILQAYSENMAPIFKEYYEKLGTKMTVENIKGAQYNVFKNLYEYDADGKNTFIVKNPYSSHNDLIDEERTFLKKILFEMYKVKCLTLGEECKIKSADDPTLLTNMPKNYLYVPLQRASKATRRGHALSNWKNKMRRFANRITNPRESAEELAGYMTTEMAEERDMAAENLRVYNPYKRGLQSPEERNAMISYKGDDYFEINMENICVDFLATQIRCEDNEKLALRIKAIELGVALQGIAENDLENSEHTIKAMDDYLALNVFNQSIMEKTSKQIDSYLAPLRSFASLYYIAANPAAMVRDTIQGIMANFSFAAIKFQTKVNPVDIAYGFKAVLEDSVTDIKTMSILNQINIRYGVSNFDAAQVSERLKSSRKGALNYDEYAFLTLRAPDYLNRMTLLMANFHHDGIHKAFSLDAKGKLVYDWRKDERFSILAKGDTKHKKYKAQQSLYFSLIRAINLQTGSNLTFKDDLPDPYPPEMIRTLKTLGDSIYGAYDNANKAKYEFVALGRNIGQFSTFMNGTVENYWKEPQVSQSELTEEQETDYNGNPLYFVLDEEGNPTPYTTTENTGVPVKRWVPIMVQGVINTLWEGLKIIGHSISDPNNANDFLKEGYFNNPINRRNYLRLFNDLFMMLFHYLAFKLFIDKAYAAYKKSANGDDILKNASVAWMYRGAKSAADCFQGAFTPLVFTQQMSPAASSVPITVLNNMASYAFGDMTTGKFLMSGSALTRTCQDAYILWKRDNLTT